MTNETTAPVEQAEIAWLIEFPEAGDRYEHSKRVGPARPVEWLAGIPWGEQWKSRTNDPNKAIRFARKADAEAAMLIMQLAGTAAFVCEHMWMGSARAEQPRPTEAGGLRDALRDLADAARSACDAKQHPPLIEALANADYALAQLPADREAIEAATFKIGERVTKRAGSAWTGKIVGT